MSTQGTSQGAFEPNPDPPAPLSSRSPTPAPRNGLLGAGCWHGEGTRHQVGAPHRPIAPAGVAPTAIMDFGWPAPPPSAGGACSDLNLLQDGLLIDLDDKTLQVGRRGRRGAANGPPNPAAAASGNYNPPPRRPSRSLPPRQPSPFASSAAVPDGRAVRRFCSLHLWQRRCAAAGGGGERQRRQAGS